MGRAVRKRDSVTHITECMTGLLDYALVEIQGRGPMKTLLIGIAFAMGIVLASQAFAAAHCPNGIWQSGHYVCSDE